MWILFFAVCYSCQSLSLRLGCIVDDVNLVFYHYFGALRVFTHVEVVRWLAVVALVLRNLTSAIIFITLNRLLPWWPFIQKRLNRCQIRNWLINKLLRNWSALRTNRLSRPFNPWHWWCIRNDLTRSSLLTTFRENWFSKWIALRWICS